MTQHYCRRILADMAINDLLNRLSGVGNKSAFARESGISRSTLLRILADRSYAPGYVTLQRLEKQFAKMDKRGDSK